MGTLKCSAARKDRHDFAQLGARRFINENWLAGAEYLQRLFQMGVSPIVGFQQHAVHLFEQLGDRIDHLQAKFLHVGRVPWNSAGTRFDIATAKGIGGDDFARLLTLFRRRVC